MNDKVRVKGRLSLYMQWPLLLSTLLIVVTMVVGAIDIRAGAVMSGFTILYILIALWIYLYQRKNVLAGMVEFSSEYAWIQKRLLSEMMQPYGIADEKGRLLWMNQAFAELLGVERHSRKSLMTLFPEMTKALLDDRSQAVSVSDCRLLGPADWWVPPAAIPSVDRPTPPLGGSCRGLVTVASPLMTRALSR